MIKPKTHIEISRDRDDDRLIECVKDADALYIKIITAKEFCDNYL